MRRIITYQPRMAYRLSSCQRNLPGPFSSVLLTSRIASFSLLIYFARLIHSSFVVWFSLRVVASMGKSRLPFQFCLTVRNCLYPLDGLLTRGAPRRPLEEPSEYFRAKQGAPTFSGERSYKIILNIGNITKTKLLI